ncbi:ArsR/SmtB family transcription factor [Pseudogemmobacter bohemicus]|uniref:ArsR/SmtB family transcription factor n=1 Tax=Pseudogemmobacter bohemicus TaxID=2250708 RepID=UPI000DD4A1E0|nr:metalloregulator ArsR/SmtB family transcription factor [Pseudogemmobacter bohemicus]
MLFPACTTPKQEIFESLASLAQAVGHVNRLELLEHLAQGPRTVEDLSLRSGMAFANTSRHLQILRRAGIVRTEREGKFARYSLNGTAEIVLLIKALGQAAEKHDAAVDRALNTHFRNHDASPPLRREELAERLRAGGSLVIDVRAEDEFAVSHIPGASNIPMFDLHNHLEDLPAGREIIVYCRGPYCAQAYEAVGFLRSQGRTAIRLEDGFPEWRAFGFPVHIPDVA